MALIIGCWGGSGIVEAPKLAVVGGVVESGTDLQNAFGDSGCDGTTGVEASFVDRFSINFDAEIVSVSRRGGIGAAFGVSDPILSIDTIEGSEEEVDVDSSVDGEVVKAEAHFSVVGWASEALDPLTGDVFVQLAQGLGGEKSVERGGEGCLGIGGRTCFKSGVGIGVEEKTAIGPAIGIADAMALGPAGLIGNILGDLSDGERDVDLAPTGELPVQPEGAEIGDVRLTAGLRMRWSG